MQRKGAGAIDNVGVLSHRGAVMLFMLRVFKLPSI